MLTIKVYFGNSLKNCIGNFLHKHGMIRVAYESPVLDSEGNEIGRVCTLVGTKKALWLMRFLFGKELVVLPFSIV